MTRLIKSSPQSGPAKQYGLFIRRYLRQHRRLLDFGLGCSGIFIVLFILYDLPLAAVLYPLLLSAVAGSMLLLWDIRQSWRRH